eukprot:350030_1
MSQQLQLSSWLKQQRLDQISLELLKQNGIESLDDLKKGLLTIDDVESVARELKLNTILKNKFIKAAKELSDITDKTQDNPSNEDYTPLTISPKDVTVDVDGMEVENEFAKDDEKVNQEIDGGILVDTGKKIEVSDDDSDTTEETLLRYYDDLNGDSTVADLRKKMKRYLCDDAYEEYQVYKDKERQQSAGPNQKLSEIRQKQEDEGGETYVVYAKKTFKANDGNNLDTCNKLVNLVTDMREISKHLAASLSTKDSLVKTMVVDLEELFDQLDQDPSLRTFLSLKKSKNYLDGKRKAYVEEEKERLRKQLKYPEPSALSTWNKWIGLTGSLLGVLAMTASLYAWKQKKNIAHWDNESVTNKEILNDYYKGKATAADAKGALGKWDEAKAQQKRNASRQRRRRIAKGFSKGLQVAGGIMQAAGLVLGVAELIIAQEEKAEYYTNQCKQLNDELKTRCSDYEEMAIMYDGVCDTLWNLKTVCESSCKEQCEGLFKDIKRKPGIMQVRQNIRQNLGATKELDALLEAVNAAVKNIIKYFNGLIRKYVEHRSKLQSAFRYGPANPNYSAIFKAIIEEINEDYTEPVSGEDLEDYYHMFLVYLFHAFKAKDKDSYKYKIPASSVGKDSIVIEVLDRDNILKNDLYKCQFFKEFNLDAFIEDEMAQKETELKYIAFIRSARQRFIMFSGAASNDERLQKLKNPFEKYPIRFMSKLLKIYKANKITNIYCSKV